MKFKSTYKAIETPIVFFHAKKKGGTHEYLFIR